MKKLNFIPCLLFILLICFTSCKDTPERQENSAEIDKVGTEKTGPDEIAYSEFSQYDSNRDGSFDQNEFVEHYESDFRAMDMDEDGSLNEEEFNASIFQIIDRDRNSTINEPEWNRSKEVILNEGTGKMKYTELDTNGDSQITREEWKKRFEASNLFTSYDSDNDNLIQLEEWNNGFFNTLDKDDNGSIDEEEFRNFSSNSKNEENSPQPKQ